MSHPTPSASRLRAASLMGPSLLASVVLCAACNKRGSQPPDLDPAPAPPSGAKKKAPASSEIDLYGDALPEGAIGRLGSLRMVDRSIRHMIFTPQGTEVISTHSDGYQVWNLRDGTRGRLLRQANPGDFMAVSLNSKILATVNDSGTRLQLWDLDTGKKTLQVALNAKPVGLCFLSNSRLLAGFARGKLRTWDTGGEKDEFAQPWREGSSMACAPSSGWVIMGTSTGDAFAVQLNAKNNSVIKTTKLGSASKSIESTAISRDGTTFAFGSADESIYLWHGAQAEVPISIHAHKHTIKSVAFTPDGKSLYSTGGDSWFRTWNPQNGKLRKKIHGPSGLDAQFMALSPDGNLIASWSEHSGARGSEAGRWWLWNATSGAALLEPMRHQAPLTAASYSSDGSKIVTASKDRTIRLWDAKSTQILETESTAGGAVNDARFSEDGTQVYSAGEDAQVRIWNVNRGRSTTRIRGTGGSVNRLLYGEIGQRILTGDQIGRVWSWDRKTGKRIQGHDRQRYSAIYDIARSPDSKILAIAGSQAVITVIDLETGQELASLTPKNAASNHALAFSPDGTVLATSGDGQTIELWNTVDWSRRKSLAGHDGTVLTLAFSPDGSRIVSGGNDELVRVWDLETGDQVAKLAGHQGVVTRVSVAPSGLEIVSASEDHTALIWRMP